MSELEGTRTPIEVIERIRDEEYLLSVLRISNFHSGSITPDQSQLCGIDS
jgi:hypothetical protein